MKFDQVNKILEFENLSQISSDEKSKGKKIALCHGVFDLVHPGHIRHLKVASQQADILIVSITSDRYVNKGPGRPVYNAQLRAETLAALECIDFVVVNDAPSAVEVITKVCPDVYVKGNDYSNSEEDVTGLIVQETNAAEVNGGKIFFTDEMVMSSSEILNAYFDIFRPETQSWLNSVKDKYGAGQIIEYLTKLNDKSVLVIGESIIDEYYFCEGLGKSTKDPILAFKFCSSETHAGGSLAVANHMAGLCENVGLISLIGERDSNEGFIKDNLNKRIDFKCLSQPGAPTISKRRYIDNHTGGKVFELYTMEDALLDEDTEKNLIDTIRSTVNDYDIVVVADYGHGMISTKIVELLTKEVNFLAVNTQANAGNRGFNTISKYPRADYVCLNGGEVELDARVRQENIRDLVAGIADRMDCNKFTITLGREGTLHYDDIEGFIESPALALNVTDRVGAGDAVLAVTTPMVALGIPWDVVGFIGNLVGAEVVAELGTKHALDVANLIKHVQSILK